MTRIKFMNTEIDNLTMQEVLQSIDQLVQEDKCAYVVTPNVDHIVQLETDKQLQDAYANASLILTDGKPLLWMAKFYGTPIKERYPAQTCFRCCVVWRQGKVIKCSFWGRRKELRQKLQRI